MRREWEKIRKINKRKFFPNSFITRFTISHSRWFFLILLKFLYFFDVVTCVTHDSEFILYGKWERRHWKMEKKSFSADLSEKKIVFHLRQEMSFFSSLLSALCCWLEGKKRFNFFLYILCTSLHHRWEWEENFQQLKKNVKFSEKEFNTTNVIVLRGKKCNFSDKLCTANGHGR